MELTIALIAGFSLMTFAFLVIVRGLGQHRKAEKTPTQTEWDGDQLLVMSMAGLEAGKYRMDDTLYIRTERRGKVIEFRISVWAPLFEEMQTGKLNVLNVKLLNSYIIITGTIEL